ncbi:MAG: hypothetical protein WDZ45_02645 [Flavobacteriaceae bacterium]
MELTDFFDQECTPPAEEVNYQDLVTYVATKKTMTLDLADFLHIETGFRNKWNSHHGDLIGDGEFKNAVYRHLEKEMEEKRILNPIPQPLVDTCVDLILDYMASIGQYSSDFSLN